MSAPASDLQGVSGSAHARAIPRLKELLAVSRQAAHEMVEAEEALDPVMARFEHAQDPQAKGELAAEALAYVERQLELTQQRRRQLDGVEGTLWARRNDLERFLIRTRGLSWWHARRRVPRPDAGRFAMTR